MTEPIQFSIIIPWKSGNIQREDSLKNMLNCLKSQELIDINSEPIIFELIIVEQTIIENSYKCTKRIKELIPQELAELKYIQLFKKDTLFNKSWCMNVGAKNSFYNHLLFMDADSLFGKNYLKIIKDYIQNTSSRINKIMFCWDTLICLPGTNNPIVRYIYPSSTMALGGIWYANKEFYFNNLGGMNENFEGYGGEDNDIYERAIFALKSNLSIIPYTLVHQYHDWEKPHKDADYLFNIARQNAQIISDRLKGMNIGNVNKPTLIKMDDLKWT